MTSIEHHKQLIALVTEYGVARYRSPKGSLKHYEVSLRRYLHSKEAAHLFTISNRGTHLIIWLTAMFHTKKINQQILEAVGEDNTITSESVRNPELALEEVRLKMREEVKLAEEVDLEELALRQYKKGAISKSEYESVIRKIKEEE